VTEHCYFWRDAETGLECKARPDYLRADNIYIDLKTTDDASHEEFSRSVAKWAYFRQAAFYTDGLKAATGRDLAGCVLIAVEKEPPYGVAVYVLDDTAIEFGRLKYKQALYTIAECRKRNEWPGYPTETQTIVLPGWMK
jgi:exodeoxyribonuclease VIII